MSSTIRFRQILGLGAPLALVLLSGCATARKAAPKTYTFFPPAPDEPRVQFLTSFSSDVDLGRRTSFADFITGRPASAKALVKPYGLALKDGQLYVCDTMASTIVVFDLARKRARNFTPRAEGRLQTPINITIDADGTRFVADRGRNQVLIFAKDDICLGAIGAGGELEPNDVAVASERLYIADRKEHCVKVYSKAERKLLFTIPRDPKAAEGKLFTPTNLALDPQGRLLVSDTGAFAVQVYDLEGKFLRTIGQRGVAPGFFARPKGIAVDREGRVYVVEAFVDPNGGPSLQAVQIFDPEGRLLLFFGLPGASAQGELYMPAAVKVDYDHVSLFQEHVAPGFKLEFLILVTSQFGGNKVSVYGFLQKR